MFQGATGFELPDFQITVELIQNIQAHTYSTFLQKNLRASAANKTVPSSPDRGAQRRCSGIYGWMENLRRWSSAASVASFAQDWFQITG